MKQYKPGKRRDGVDNRVVLAKAWQHINSIPYPATSRWLFYRLLQDGYYRKPDPPRHDDYHTQYLPLLSKARKRFYQNWQPDSVIDDRRAEHRTAQGALSVEEWLESLSHHECWLDPWTTQDCFGIIVFEADAMRRQFEWFAPSSFSLWPFGGDPSIEYKWRLAKFIDSAFKRYGNPVTVFYFGDLDTKGIQIAENAFKDIWVWCETEFEFVRGGLNPGDAEQYNIPENFQRPDQYQWVALTHEAAGDIITRTLNGFYQPGQTIQLQKEAKQATQAYQNALSDLVNPPRHS